MWATWTATSNVWHRFVYTELNIVEIPGVHINVGVFFVAQFLNQHFSELDLKEFFLLYGESFTHKNSVDKVIGPDSGLSGGEASLDVEVEFFVLHQ